MHVRTMYSDVRDAKQHKYIISNTFCDKDFVHEAWVVCPEVMKQKIPPLEELVYTSIGDLLYKEGHDLYSVLIQHCEEKWQEALLNVAKRCTYLRKIFHTILPASIANKFTKTALRRVWDCNYLLMRASDRHLTPKWYSEFQQVMQELLSVALHPDITQITMTPLVMSAVYRSKLRRNLRALEIHSWGPSEPEEQILQLLSDDLESFVFHYCSDWMVSAISRHSPGLKLLNISLSPRLTDSCVQSLLDLRLLESLDLTSTDISPDGYQSLLQALGSSSPPRPLVSLTWSSVRTSHLNLLHSSALPNLRRLGIAEYGTDTSLVWDLKHIESLRFENCPFWQIQQILLETCEGLQELCCDGVGKLDLLFVLDICPILRRLRVYSRFRPLVLAPGKDGPGNLPLLTDINLLDCLDISLIKVILGSCPNLRRLQVWVKLPPTTLADVESFLRQVLHKNPLVHLEHFALLSPLGGLLSLQAVQMLIESCPKICSIESVSDKSQILAYLKDVDKAFIKIQ